MCSSPDINNTHCFYTPLLSSLLFFFFAKTMSLAFRRNSDNSDSIRPSGCIHGMQRLTVDYDSPEEKSEERDDDDLGSCSSSSIGRNSDVSCDSPSDSEDSTGGEVQSQLKGPLDTMDALEEVLPLRKGISKFYNGKAKSFTSLADAAAASSVKDFAKPEDPYNRKRKNLLACSLRDNPLRNNGGDISKRLANPNRSTVALGTTMSSTDCNSITSLPSGCLPPLHPQFQKSTTIGPSSSSSSSSTIQINPPCRSFSLSDLQFVTATPNIAGLAVHSGNKDNKLR